MFVLRSEGWKSSRERESQASILPAVFSLRCEEWK